MNDLPRIENAVAAIRVSSTKQGLQGDSPQAQKEQIEQFAKAHNINVKKFFIFMESASKEEQPVQEAIDYCKDPKNDVQLFVIKSIDRFTRGGSYIYDHLKMQLTKYGVKLIDIYGIISNHEVNTLEHLGLEYNWSVYSPSKKSEILEAERSKDEIRDILSRMIGAEIRYVRMGYRVCLPPFGYKNEKIETANGKRVILIPHPIESKWIIRMFELRMRGTMTDQQIVDEINNLGFKTRKHYLRNPKDRSQITGSRVEKPLTLKQFWRYIESPVYAGVSIHKWTGNKPIKGQFEGLVSYETFNEANRGKLVISEENGEITISKRPLKDWQLKKLAKNPDFPYKKYVLCPICRKPFFGSASRGRHGGRFPAYHCNRGHKYLRIPVKEFEETIKKFINGLEITQEYIDTLKEESLKEWQRRMGEKQNDSSDLEQKIEALKLSTISATEKIKMLSSEIAIRALEADLIKAEIEIKALEQQKEEKDLEVINMEIVLENVEYYMKNLDDLLFGTPDPLRKAAFFGALFEEPPTYEELILGTPKLERCIALNEIFKQNQSQMVTLLHFISNFFYRGFTNSWLLTRI